MDTQLQHEINPVIRAQRQHAAVTGTGWGTTATLAISVLLAVSARMMPLWHPGELLMLAALSITAGILIGGVTGWGWPIPYHRRLRQIDRRLKLADRLTTAWELEQGHIAAPPLMVRQQRSETVSALQKRDPRQAFPLQLSKATTHRILGLGLLLLVLILLPNPQTAELARLEALQQAAEAEAAALEQTRSALEETQTLDPETREAALRALEEALAVLEDRRATQEERQQALIKAEQQLAELRTPETAARVQHLAEAAPLSTETILQPLAKALQSGDLDAAAAYLRSLTDPEGDRLTEEEILALADALAAMADALQETEPDLASQFREVSSEMYTGDTMGAMEALNHAAETLAEAGAANAPNEALETAQAQVQNSMDHLGAAQAEATSPAAQPGVGQTQAGTNTGQLGGNGQGGQNAETGPGAQGHQEDAGSSEPYGDEETARIEEQNGAITLPREIVMGDPQITDGAANESRVPYREVYATYAEAAEADLSRRSLPPALRSYVRDYFSALNE